MKKLFQSNNRMYCLTNICVCLLCSSYLYTGYYNVDNNVQQELDGTAVEKDSDPLSKENEPKVNVVKTEKVEVKNQQVVKKTNVANKVTTTKKKVVTSNKTTTSSKKYVKPNYDSVTGSAVVNYAKKYLGLRYVSGGNSLTKGTDCSGFTKLIYKEFGITLSRSVKSQVKNGTYVKKSDLQKGDLIFYGKKSGVVSHVAIYIGNGKVIHQSTPKSGVKINSMNMMVYITARRVITKPSTTSPNTKNEGTVNNENVNNNSTTNSNTNVSNENVNNNSTTNNNTNVNNENVNNNSTTNSNTNVSNENVNNNSTTNNNTNVSNENVNNNSTTNNNTNVSNENVNKNSTTNNNTNVSNENVNNITNDSSIKTENNNQNVNAENNNTNSDKSNDKTNLENNNKVYTTSEYSNK